MNAPDKKKFGIGKMVGVALGAFAFTFSLVPLYRIACEKVFGVRLEKEAIAAPLDAKANVQRTVTVVFDGGVNSKLPWEFEPQQATMQVHPGQQYEASYFARNTSNRAIVGNAVLYVDGQAVASLEGGELCIRAALPPGARVDNDLTYHPPPRPSQPASQAALPL